MRRRATLALIALVGVAGLTGCSSGKKASPATSPTTAALPTTAASATTSLPTAAGGNPDGQRYVSLGDSYPAGEGLPQPVPPCGRTPLAYPNVVATDLHASVSHHACNGATTADVLDAEQAPGVGRQIDAVTAGAEVVTISIGGNDLGFAQVMRDCVLNQLPCTRLDPQVSQALATLRPRLEQIYREIRRRAPSARLIVVGYPQLVVDLDQAGLASCAGLTPDEAGFVRRKGDELDAAVSAAADAAGARYVDTAAAFAGHEACSAQPWMEGINFTDIVASFHPNAAGHQQLARLVEAAFPGH